MTCRWLTDDELERHLAVAPADVHLADELVRRVLAGEWRLREFINLRQEVESLKMDREEVKRIAEEGE